MIELKDLNTVNTFEYHNEQDIHFKYNVIYINNKFIKQIK